MHTTTIINFITFSLASLAAAAPVDPAVTNPTPTAAAGSPSPRSVEGGLAPRELKAQCNYKNAVFMDVYTIFGRDYAGTGPGQGGEHVRNNLKGCGGTLSGFKFKPKADDAPEGGWEWTVDFNLPFYQNRCVANVIATVGGGRIKCEKFN